MDAEPARLIIEALKEEKIDLYVTLPEEPAVSLTQAVQADPYFQCVTVASEDSGVALTARSPAEPPDRSGVFHQNEKGFTIPPVLRYSSGY
jgi:hypothetical protein